MFNDAFRGLAQNKETDLFPRDIAAEQEKLSDFIYDKINNGVYKAGFTARQHVYERACKQLFDALDQLEERLARSRYLFGTRIVETDWRLFCTLIRFDVVYYIHFKCSLRRILDYHNLQGYLIDLYQHDGIAETVNFDHIKRHYYMTHGAINPSRIVPIGPILDLTREHGRARLGNARLACCVCFIPVIAAARRLFRELAAGVRGDESRPNALGEKRQPSLIAR
jgi:putative glutathione S-transferase